LKIKSSIWNVRTIFLILSIIPVIALSLITLNLILGSVHAISTLGLNLFSNSFSLGIEPAKANPATLHYGLLPALWGTFLVILISICVAFPVSLALAILANDFSTGFLSTAIRWLIGILSGIPPVIYALMGSVFFIWFFFPKFAGQGLSSITNPPLPSPQMLPSDASCTLLGGLMLALLLIPFITPLLDDAFQSVPATLKEASLSLGANRWYTLKSITIPNALPGIVNSLLLGILTALGEAIIVSYCIGFSTRSLPTPVFDVLQRTAPLTSIIATLAGGGFSSSKLVGPIGTSVASFAGLLLLIVAFIILGVTSYLQRKMKARLA